MTHKIPRSSIPAGVDLNAEVAAYVADLKEWGQHNARCVAEAARRKNTDPAPVTPPENQPYPAPIASRLVWSALEVDWNTDGTVNIVTDYEIEEDGPTPAEQLVARRNELLGRVATMEMAAGDAVVPSAKRRHIEFLATDAEAVDPDKRTDADRLAIAARDDMRVRLDAIARHGAKLQADVADLAAGATEGWTPEEFPR